jgi:Flp pilus assembly protein TadG
MKRMLAIGWGNARQRERAERGSQLLEFSLALPILLLLTLGILDFGSTFALKAKLTNAAREGARIVVSTPLSNVNCSSSVPCPIQAAVNDIKLYLTNAGVDASCFDANSPSNSTTLSWTFTCSNGASIEINRGLLLTTGTLTVPSTRVVLTWPVKWKLSGLLPASSFPTAVNAVATMANLTGSS